MSTMNIANSRVGETQRESDYACATLRRWLIRGDFAPGMPLDLISLQQRLGVGRTPLREAQQILAREGLLRVEPNRGTFVSAVDLNDLKRAIDARLELEPACARMVAANNDPHALVRLSQLLDNPGAFLPPDDSRDPIHVLDELFHPFFYAATGNHFIERALLPIYYYSTMASNALALPIPESDEIRDDLMRILEAVRRHDSDRAASAIHEHVQAFQRKVVSHFIGTTGGAT